MEDVQLWLRLRRERTTYFLTCGPFDSIDLVKRKLLGFHKGSEMADLRLYHATKLLDDKSNIHDQGIANNALIYFKLRKGNTGEWEDIPEIGL